MKQVEENKIVIYTVKSNSDSKITDPLVVDKGIDYLCFTNFVEGFKAKVFKPIKLSEFNPKLLPHLVPELQKYTLSIYLDPSIQIVSSLESLIEEVKFHDYSLIPHDRLNIVNEAKANSTLAVERQLRRYLEAKYPKDRQDLWLLDVIVRQHMQLKVKEFSEQFYNDVKKGIPNKRMAFSFALWRFKYSVHAIRSLKFDYQSNQFTLGALRVNLSPIKSKSVLPEKVLERDPVAKSNKILFYSAITDDYDKLPEIPETVTNYDAVCFTKNCKDVKSKTWKIVEFKADVQGELNKEAYSRFVKLQIHKLFYVKDYKYVVWLDGNIRIKKSIDFLFSDLGEAKLGIFKHHLRDCLFEEANRFIELRQQQENAINLQIKYYSQEGMQEHYGLFATHCLIYKPLQEVFEFLNKWYEQVKRFSTRDQISLPFVIWKTNFMVRTIMGCEFFSNKWLEFFSYIWREQSAE